MRRQRHAPLVLLAAVLLSAPSAWGDQQRVPPPAAEPSDAAPGAIRVVGAGGWSVLCSASDVTPDMVAAWRAKHGKR